MAKEKKEDWGSGFLYVENLLHDRQYRTVSVTIEEVIPKNTVTAANKKLIDKPILKFVGKERLLVLNKTNQAILRVSIGDDDLTKAVGSTITLQPRIVEGWGEQMPAIRVMPPEGMKIRKDLVKRLGEKAVWTGPPATEEKPKTAKKTEEPKKPMYAQVCEKIDGKTPAELQAEHGTILGFITKLNADGSITDAEFADLGQRINTRLAEGEATEEPTEAEGSTAD